MLIKRLNINDLDAMYAIYTEHTKFQGIPAENVFGDAPNYNSRWYNWYKHKLLDSNLYVYGALNKNNRLLSYVITEKWDYYDEVVWTHGRMTATKSEILDRTHGLAHWPDCLVECVNTAIRNYEEFGIYKLFGLRPTVGVSWIPITDVSICLLNKYKYTFIEELRCNYRSKEPLFFHYVQSSALFKTPQHIYSYDKVIDSQ